MQRAIQLLGKTRLGQQCIASDQLPVAAWPQAAGPKLARRTQAVAYAEGRLVIEVEDEVWRSQLGTLRQHFLTNLERVLGGRSVTTIEFRVVPQRRGPQRAEIAVHGASADEADAIADPTLRAIYMNKRKSAQSATVAARSRSATA